MEGGKLSHSQSQPGGMDRTPPGTPKKGGKMLAVRVQMLDDTVTMFQVQAKALGKVLFGQVCSQLHLLESDYFGLEYQEEGGTKYWLDLEKPLSRQIGLSLVDTLVRFCVKFYTPDPSQLEEEFTRYLFCLQIKRDLSQGLLQCNNNTAALMASYIVQAECGDYVAEDYPDYRYLSSYKFVPNQDHELEKRIMENHKKHAGQSPAEADLNLLETARRCELYGIKMHPAKDHEGVPLNLAVAHMGIVVFQNFTKINTFSWAKIRKISFKRKRFLVKLHPEGYGYYKDTVEFFFEGRNECKNFWKKCVENHGFFRCTTVKKVPRQKTRVLSRGSSFRYSGRTQKQIVDFVRENYVKRQTFQRSQSFRHSSSAHASVANVGTSISAHPLLPLGENAVAGTPASLSCGSMTLTSSPIHAADIHTGGLPSPPAITSASPSTSVTSSPQHFYPQENHYPRAGHQLAKVTHPHDHFHRGISANQDRTNVTTVSTHSANLSNSNLSNIVDDEDIKMSRTALDYANFNDVYSNCYSSLRSLHNDSNSSDFNHNKMKAEGDDFNDHFLNEASKSNESIRSAAKSSKFFIGKKGREDDDFDWHRSASYKDLYRNENDSIEAENAKNLKRKSKTCRENSGSYLFNLESETILQNGRRSRGSSIGIDGKKRYTINYVNTASSLSTESAEEEPEDPFMEAFDGIKYCSQEDMVLSHDDVSHDSYELLEKDPGEFEDELLEKKRRRTSGENDRARSCSWGSDRGMSLLNFRSTDNMLNKDDKKIRENGFWSLERERGPKHKSEGDFRSLDRKKTRGMEGMGGGEYLHKSVSSGSKRNQRSCELEGLEKLENAKNIDDVFDALTQINQVDTEAIMSKELAEKEYLKLLEREPWMCSQRGGHDQDRGGMPERTKYQVRKKSLEKCEPFLMKIEPEEKFTADKHYRSEERRRVEKRREKKEERFHEGIKEKEQLEWEKENERRQLERMRNLEQADKETLSSWHAKDYSDFKEIHPKKFDRVVSNQFGKYSEFLGYDKKYDLLEQERKVMENYEKVCQVGKIAKAMELKEKNFFESDRQSVLPKNYPKETNPMKIGNDIKNYRTLQLLSRGQLDSEKSNVEDFDYATVPPSGKAGVERTKSDPFSIRGNLKRNVLMHQKSIDLTSQSESRVSDQSGDDFRLTKTSRSEHDIPYVLHKRHMNGSLCNMDGTVSKTGAKSPSFEKSKIFDDLNSTEEEDPLYEVIKPKKSSVPAPKTNEKTKSLPKVINLDEELGNVSRNIGAVKKPSSFQTHSKPPLGKKPVLKDGGKAGSMGRQVVAKESNKVESFAFTKTRDSVPIKTSPKEVIYSKVSAKGSLPAKSSVKESAVSKESFKEVTSPGLPVKNLKQIHEMEPNASKLGDKKEEPIYAEVYRGKIIDKKEELEGKSLPPLPPERTTSIQKLHATQEIKQDDDKATVNLSNKVRSLIFSELNRSKPTDSETPTKKHEILMAPLSSSKVESSEGLLKAQTIPVRGVSGPVQHRRKESLILFARTRLGLSEGSAFAPVRGKDSPVSQRRTKSLDAPYISLHRLPPADAFSSKDDTVDGNEDDVLPCVERVAESFKKEMAMSAVDDIDKLSEGKKFFEPVEPETNSAFSEKLEIRMNIKKWAECDVKVESAVADEKILDGIRSKRLLSKIESVDGVDSEGDMDSSKLTDALSIPSDRLVNLPESVRFPSVRQISGQTSEESADGWEQREVKVKRRTPRRSVGREESHLGIQESVVWDSKDDEIPDDEVWDESLVFPGKLPDAIVPAEYLKRGSCGQSIDDDNLSTPIKESSPEHWVSVDDLPEAIEREEKLLRQQEKILREKILNEKLKRELNLDTIEVDERVYDYKVTYKQSQEDDTEDVKGKFKGHSLDTYELTEKRLREKGENKNCSLDEHILREKRTKSYVTIPSNFEDSDPTSGESSDTYPHNRNLEYLQCKVVNDLREIDQIGVSNDDELEEFFVVLDEKDTKNDWETENGLVRESSKEESLISVPEGFRDSDDIPSIEAGDETQTQLPAVANIPVLGEETHQVRETGTEIKISSHEGSRRSSVDFKMLSVDDNGRLSPYECSLRRNSSDFRRASASDEPDRLSPCNDLRLGGDESRRLSSEDSRKCSMSESVSEETRRRLSSTEETRRKRASLTKQCSVGADSLTDEMVSGVPECNSSFDQDDEKDVFETEQPVIASDETVDDVQKVPQIKELQADLLVEASSKKKTGKDTFENQEEKRDIPDEPANLKICAEEIDRILDMPEKASSSSFTWDSAHSHHKLAKVVSHVKSPSIPFTTVSEKYVSAGGRKNSFDSSQDSDIDRLSEISLIFHVQNQISRRNLSEAGKCLRNEGVDLAEKVILSSTDGSSCRTSSDEQGLNLGRRYSSDDMEKTETSSVEGKSSAEEDRKQKGERKITFKGRDNSEKEKVEDRQLIRKEYRAPDDKRDSGEDGSSSSSAPFHPKRELSSTWKPFLLESSGSSSLEENWLPPDDNAHLADEEETSSTSNNQQDESGHEDIDYPAGLGFPAVNVSSAEMIVGGYGGVYALSRTLSRISERSTSEQEKSDAEDDFTKPSSHSISAEEESMLSSDRQPSLSSDPPSLRGSATRIPDLPDDHYFVSENVTISEEKKTVCEPFGGIIPPPLPDEDWTSPVTSSAVYDTSLKVSHIETVYLEIYPEEACKVVVAEPQLNEENSSSDENHTLQEEGEYLHLSSDNISISTTTTTTTQDGTVVHVNRKNARAGSISEDVSLMSTSEWSISTTGKSRANSVFAPLDDHSEKPKCLIKSSPEKRTSKDDKANDRDLENLKLSGKIKPPKLRSPTGKIGFFETPVSKVRSPTSQVRFFEQEEPHPSSYYSLKSPTCRSESSSPKNNCKRFFESPIHRFPESYESPGSRNSQRAHPGCHSEVKYSQNRGVCTPYYSNVAEGAEKSFFGRYDTGSLERTKIIHSRKCRSYYSMAKAAPEEEDSSNSEENRLPSSYTIPRASKKTKKRHRVAMDLEICDGRIVAPPKTRATIIENTDSDRSSPENSVTISENSMDVIDNYNVLSSTPLQNGKANGDISTGDGKTPNRSSSGTPLRFHHSNNISSPDGDSLIHSDTMAFNKNNPDPKSSPTDLSSVQMSFENKSNLQIDGAGNELEVKKKRYNADKGYFMIKELLSTERTYKKNLDVINKWFHEEVSKAEDDMPDDVLNGLFNLFDPLNTAHSLFLRDLEQRLATWEGKSTLLHKREIQKIGDIILLHFNILPLYVKYLDKHLLVLERLDAAFRKNKKFEQIYRDFELQRICYLPLSSFIMKPLQKLLHYHSLLKRMINHYGPDHLDYKDFSLVQKKLEPIVESIPSILKVSENFVQLSELQRDMPSFEGLLQGGREFIRQGCLMKHSKKGFQQRMFFLFSDILVYTNRCTSPILQFKVNGQMPLRGVMIEESDDKIGTNYSFTIYGGNRTLVVAASSQDEKEKWLKDLYESVQNARERNDGKTLQYLSLKSCSSSDEIVEAIGDDGSANKNKNSQQRSNTTVHVCWHRNTSTGLKDHMRSYENELSGFLLRKFKNSNGWQKLWVVFANFCLFFYKAYPDESPLASLPLLGYTVTVPDEEDDIRKDYVFKLQFKNHVYFFRAESDYTFSRWMEVISSATKKSPKLSSLEEKDNS